MDGDDLFVADTTPLEAAAAVARRRDITPSAPGQVRYRDRRLLVFYFDFSSMPPADQIRAQRSALKFLDEHMTPEDLVAVMAFSSRLQVPQDFTDNRELLGEVISSFRTGEASELAGWADESEFNIFNTDLKLSALESAAKMLASLPEKKALIYLSSGVGKTGTENHSQLRSATPRKVRSEARARTPARASGNGANASTISKRPSSPWRPTRAARHCSTITTSAWA